MATLSLSPPYHDIKGKNRTPAPAATRAGVRFLPLTPCYHHHHKFCELRLETEAISSYWKRVRGLVPMLRILLLPDGHNHVSMIVVRPRRER